METFTKTRAVAHRLTCTCFGRFFTLASQLLLSHMSKASRKERAFCKKMSGGTGNCCTITVTVRVIRSLEYKNFKPLVIRNCDLDMTLGELRRLVDERLRDPATGFPPVFALKDYYDSFKLETDPQANYSKSANALINTNTPVIPFTAEGPESSRSLRSLGLGHECEVSCFNLRDYEKYLESQR